MIGSCASSACPATVDDSWAEDMRLLEGLVAGNPASWREFSRKYTRMIDACIMRVTVRFPGLVGREDVREIYALFCLNLLANDRHRLRSFDKSRGVRLSSWLGLIAVHTAYDYLRTMRRQPHGPCFEDVAEFTAQPPEAADQCERREQAVQVARLMNELSERDREFMTLYFGEGLSAEAVAERMGISIKTVYTKKHKIRGKLESLIGQQRVAA